MTNIQEVTLSDRWQRIGAHPLVWSFLFAALSTFPGAAGAVPAPAGPVSGFPTINPPKKPVEYREDRTLQSATHLNIDVDEGYPKYAPRTNTIKNGHFQRWVWCGTTCWVVINDADREYLVFDGYASKADFGADKPWNLGGTQDVFDYERDGYGGNERGSTQLARIIRLANFLRWLSDPDEQASAHDGTTSGEPYKFLGILTLHDHTDHAGDLRYLKTALELDKNERLHYTTRGTDFKNDCPEHNGGNGGWPGLFNFDDRYCDAMHSVIRTKFDPIDMEEVPVIAHWTYAGINSYNYLKGTKHAINPYTHVLVPRHNDTEKTECRPEPEPIFQIGSSFMTMANAYLSSRATLHPKAPQGSWVDLYGDAIECPGCPPKANFQLGNFAIQAFVWDHNTTPYPPMAIMWRTMSYRIRHAHAPNARMAFITGSGGQSSLEGPGGDGNNGFEGWTKFAHGVDHSFDSLLSDTDGKIRADMFLNATHSSGVLAHQMIGEAKLTRQFAFRDLGADGRTGYFVGNHIDSNDAVNPFKDLRKRFEEFIEKSMKHSFVREDASKCPTTDRSPRYRWGSTEVCLEYRILERMFLNEDPSSDYNELWRQYGKLAHCEDGHAGSNIDCYGANVDWNAKDPNDIFGYGIKGVCGDGVDDDIDGEQCDGFYSDKKCSDLDLEGLEGGLIPCHPPGTTDDDDKLIECTIDSSGCHPPDGCNESGDLCCSTEATPLHFDRSRIDDPGRPDGVLPNLYCDDPDGHDPVGSAPEHGELVCNAAGLCKRCSDASALGEGCHCSHFKDRSCREPLVCIGEVCTHELDLDGDGLPGPLRDWFCDADCYNIVKRSNGTTGTPDDGGYCQPDGGPAGEIVNRGFAFCADALSSVPDVFECRENGMIALNGTCVYECAFDFDAGLGCGLGGNDDAATVCRGPGRDYPEHYFCEARPILDPITLETECKGVCVSLLARR